MRRRSTHALAISVQGKADIVARDETETGDRMLLNLGHTFGHALEAWAGFSDRLLHGEAVAIGICLAFRLSEELGLPRQQQRARGSQAHLAARRPADPHRRYPGRPAAGRGDAVEIMGQDKKVRDGQLTLILARGIGEAFITRDVPRDKVQAFLAREIAGRRPEPAAAPAYQRRVLGACAIRRRRRALPYDRRHRQAFVGRC